MIRVKPNDTVRLAVPVTIIISISFFLPARDRFSPVRDRLFQPEIRI